jgi:hypothetical protein
MEETFLDKGILEKLTREGKSLSFYIAVSFTDMAMASSLNI